VKTEEISQLQDHLTDALKRCSARFLPNSVNDSPTMENEPYDEDQQLDDSFFSDEDEAKCEVFDTCDTSLKKDLSHTQMSHELKFFLDGSMRTYYWGDFEINGYVFPVLLAETCVAIVRRENKSFAKESLQETIHFILPPEDKKEVKILRDELLQVSKIHNNMDVNCLEKTSYNGTDIKAPMHAKVRSILHSEEVKEATKIKMQSSEILVVDGDLRSQVFDTLDGTIGLAKSFSLKPVIVTSTKYVQVYRVLCELGTRQRTCVFVKRNNPKYKFWYVRLYGPEHCDNILQGIVKIELNMSNQKSSTPNFEHYVDELSLLVFAERSPTSYPERRWASHIYPIHTAEKMAKCNLTEPLAFRQMFRI